MATTTNYNWSTPDDSSLVKDGASAIRSLGSSIDTTTKNLNPSTTLGDIEYRSSTSNTNTRLAIGSSGQGLQVVAGVPAWAASSTSTLTTTGDILYASAANTLARRGIGSTGQVLTVSGGLPTWATPASGALTWTPRLGATNTGFRSIAYNGSNLYVAVGSSGQLYTSSDAITWTSRTSGFGANAINDVAYGNGLWVAVGGNGTLTTSSDGVTWTSRTANFSTNNLYNVVYANSLWVAVGQGGGATNTGGIIYSTDGITWTRKSQTPTIGTTYYTVVWNGTNWIVGALISTNNYLYASAPSGTWTAGSTGSGGAVDKIIWDGVRHTTWENAAGEVRYSTSTTLGTTTPMVGAPYNAVSGLGSIASFVYYDSKIYVTNGTYLQSFNPTSSAAALSNNISLLPGNMGAGLTNSVLSLCVNASGIVALSTYGAIWTSF